jgi:signal transduction histidine kinase
VRRFTRFSSIVSRILWLHMIVVGSASILMPLALYQLLVSETDNLQRQAMREQAERIAAHLAATADGGWTLDLPEGMRDIFSEAYGRYAYAILDAGGQVLFASRTSRVPIFPQDTRASEPVSLDARENGAALNGASVPKEIGGRKVWIEVAENLSHRDVLIDDVVANFFQRVGWITLPILLIVLGIDVEIVRRAFRPVLAASAQASEIGPRRTDIRLPVSGIPDEIRSLVVAVNEALDRLENGLRAQKEFAADAAHELRTPLAILRTRIDTLADRHSSELLREDVESMSRTVTQLLEMAELETLHVDPADKTDLHAVCAEVVETIAPWAIAQDKTIALTGAEHPVWVKGHAEMIARAIRNLVENAIKHTPAGASVDVAVEDDGTVRVRDEGPGIGENERGLLFQRFWRRDRKRPGSAGLGLSIVQRIVEAHGGRIGVANRSMGGAEFSVNFVPVGS